MASDDIAISALCNFRVGEIFDTPETRETILEAQDEAALVAKAAGVDVLNKRKTEIDFINGAILRLGNKHGISTPVNKRLTARLVHGP